MPLLVNNNDLRRARKATELALSRYRIADSEPPSRRGRDELISVSELAEEVTGAAVRSAIEAQGKAKHGEIQTPFGFSYRGPLAVVPWLIIAGMLIWYAVRGSK